MKFSDIPMFTRDGDYEINIFLEHLENKIKEFKEDYDLELNPDFQRGHVWTEDQQIAYVEFYLKGGKTARIIYFNCPYWYDYNKGNYDMGMVCVDGLQRITALRRFLNNEIKVFGHYYKEFEDTPRMTNDGLKFNINNLKTKKEVLQWYLEFNTGGTVHSQEEIERVKKMLEDCK
jgi:hypothetical protein